MAISKEFSLSGASVKWKSLGMSNTITGKFDQE